MLFLSINTLQKRFEDENSSTNKKKTSQEGGKQINNSEINSVQMEFN